MSLLNENSYYSKTIKDIEIIFAYLKSYEFLLFLSIVWNESDQFLKKWPLVTFLTSQGQMLKFGSWERRKSGLGHPKDEKKLGPIESWGVHTM